MYSTLFTDRFPWQTVRLASVESICLSFRPALLRESGESEAPLSSEALLLLAVPADLVVRQLTLP